MENRPAHRLRRPAGLLGRARGVRGAQGGAGRVQGVYDATLVAHQGDLLS